MALIHADNASGDPVPVKLSDLGGGGVTPSNYSGDKATAVTAASDAIPDGATKMRIIGAATVIVHFIFGVDQTEAETVTTTTGVRLNALADMTVGIPSTATYVGYIAASGVETINITYGV